jgi:methionyl-tRNA formyltransferase
MANPRIVVFGYHDIGYECLQTLLESNANVVAVFTHLDKPENETIWFRSVKVLAQSYDIPVFCPDNPNDPKTVALLQTLNIDLIFSFYYRCILGNTILQLPRLGAFNMHGSLLPQYRGRVSINWAILRGETKTGVTLHHMVKRVDAGDMADQASVVIGKNETTKEVFAKVTKAARLVIKRQLPALLNGTAPRIPQNEKQASYFGGRKPEDGYIDWHQSATQIYNLIRATTHPYPGAFTEYKKIYLHIWWAKPLPGHQGEPGQVISENPLRIATGDGCLEILQYQWEGHAINHHPDKHGLRRGEFLGEISGKTAAGNKS